MIAGVRGRYSGLEGWPRLWYSLTREVVYGDYSMAILARSENPEDLRDRLIEEAEEHRRRHPVPPIGEVVEEILGDSLFCPADAGAPDSTTLLRESRGYDEDSTSREALTCTPQELVETSWEWTPDTSLNREETKFPEELRRQLVEEAEAYRRRHPVPPLREVVEEIIRTGTYRPADFGAPDSTELIREARER
jgi:hypothetical protein